LIDLFTFDKYKKPHFFKKNIKKAVLYIFLTVLCIVVSRETIYNISIKFNGDRTKRGKVLLMKFYVITFDGEESQKTGYLSDYFRCRFGR